MITQTRTILLTLGIGAVGIFSATQVSAQQAYASGSSTITLMNGAAMSIGAEISAPGGSTFGAAPSVIMNPVISSNATTALSDNDAIFSGATTLTPGAVTAAPAGASFTAVAAAKLADLDGAGAGTNALDDFVSIIRAGAGVDGLD